jgi:Na+-exporting ATPase
MALSYGTLDFIEGAVISAVILLNIILGFGYCPSFLKPC